MDLQENINRIKLPHNIYEHEHYRVDFYFIGGYGSSNWPANHEVLHKFDTILSDAWNLVYDYTGQSIDSFTKHVKSCDE